MNTLRFLYIAVSKIGSVKNDNIRSNQDTNSSDYPVTLAVSGKNRTYGSKKKENEQPFSLSIGVQELCK
ncbi:MAG: hypothetical protein K0A89_05385 [ANME-2 cluster archaeon]|nr:hypothetical protein [ANME-2 cluster archaeon]